MRPVWVACEAAVAFAAELCGMMALKCVKYAALVWMLVTKINDLNINDYSLIMAL